MINQIYQTFLVTIFCGTLFTIFFSNFMIILNTADSIDRGNGISFIQGVWKFPKQFEIAFTNNFRFRDKLLTFHDNLYFSFFNETSNPSFYLTPKKSEKTAFFTRHPGSLPDRIGIRYDLLFTLLKGGYNEKYKNIERATSSILKQQDFLNNMSIPVLLLSFPTKPILQFYELPKFIQNSVGEDSYIEPVQKQILNSLPYDFSSKFILDLFPIAIAISEKTTLFPQHNFHWVDRSYYTNNVAAKIAQRFGNVDAKALNIEEYEIVNIQSYIRHLTNLDLPLTPFLRLPMEKLNKMGVKNLGGSHYINSNNKGKIIVIGDSFASGLAKDLAIYFEEVRTFGNRAVNKENIALIYEEYHPDYIVFLKHQGLIAISGVINKFSKLYRETMLVLGERKFKDTAFFLTKGWHNDKKWGNWSSETARLGFQDFKGGESIFISYYPFVTVSEFDLSALVNGIKIPILTHHKTKRENLKIDVLKEFIDSNGNVILQFDITGATSPVSINYNSNKRILGIGIYRIYIKN